MNFDKSGRKIAVIVVVIFVAVIVITKRISAW